MPTSATAKLMRMPTPSPIWSSVASSKWKRSRITRPIGLDAKACSSEIARPVKNPRYIVTRNAPVTTICCAAKRASPIKPRPAAIIGKRPRTIRNILNILGQGRTPSSPSFSIGFTKATMRIRTPITTVESKLFAIVKESGEERTWFTLLKNESSPLINAMPVISQTRTRPGRGATGTNRHAGVYGLIQANASRLIKNTMPKTTKSDCRSPAISGLKTLK